MELLLLLSKLFNFLNKKSLLLIFSKLVGEETEEEEEDELELICEFKNAVLDDFVSLFTLQQPVLISFFSKLLIALDRFSLSLYDRSNLVMYKLNLAGFSLSPFEPTVPAVSLAFPFNWLGLIALNSLNHTKYKV